LELQGVQGARPLPAGGMSFAEDAFRRGPDKVCRNSLAGFVMLPGLELRAGNSALCVSRPGSKRCLRSVRQPTALARPTPERLSWCGKV